VLDQDPDMPEADTELGDHSGLSQAPFWAVFAESQIPMSLVDRERRCVQVNDAIVRLFEYRPEEMVGNRVGGTVVDEEPTASDARWEELLRTNELYAQRTVLHSNGSKMRVSYAAHGTTVGDTWLALFVTVSARFVNGEELIGRPEKQLAPAGRSRLTPREHEVVKLVALGCNTGQIAAELFVSPATVRSHVRNAMGKMESHTRAQLVARVLADGLVPH
jgi:PAS domain S-box-containing protein